MAEADAGVLAVIPEGGGAAVAAQQPEGGRRPRQRRAGGPPRTAVETSIDALKAERDKLLQDKKRVRKDLKNAQRRHRRLKHKANKLTNEDLYDIMKWRDIGPDGPLTAEGSPAAAAAAAEGAEEPAEGGQGKELKEQCASFPFGFCEFVRKSGRRSVSVS